MAYPTDLLCTNYINDCLHGGTPKLSMLPLVFGVLSESGYVLISKLTKEQICENTHSQNSCPLSIFQMLGLLWSQRLDTSLVRNIPVL